MYTVSNCKATIAFIEDEIRNIFKEEDVTNKLEEIKNLQAELQRWKERLEQLTRTK